MNTEPLVSVIVPAYNAEEYISQCVDSILAQTYQELEIIVVDDGSTDRTHEIVQGYHPKVRYYCQGSNAGPSVARNVGIQNSSGQYICFLDADDLMRKDRISMKVDFMRRNPEVGIVFCDYSNFDDKRQLDRTHFETCNLLMEKLSDKKEILLKNAIIDLAHENFGIAGNFLFRRSMLDIESGFDHRFWGGEDFHFYYRLARHTPVGIIRKVGMDRRLHSVNATQNRQRMVAMNILAWTDLHETEKDPAARALLGKRIATFQSSLSRLHANKGEYLQALWYEWQALSKDMCYRRLATSLWSFARTAAMALGVHRPQEL